MLRIIGKDSLLKSLKTNLSGADTVEVAVAWATPSDALSEILEFSVKSATKPRVIVGTSGNGTHPISIQRLMRVTELKLTSGDQGIFHPKFYRFVYGDGAICWCGSANLSIRGFGLNDEAMVEFSDDGVGKEWFDRLWTSLPHDTEEKAKDYISKWSPPNFGDAKWDPASKAAINHPRRRKIRDHPIKLLASNGVKNWGSYLEALRRCDEFWEETDDGHTVFGENRSYMHTIRSGYEVACGDDWSVLSKEDVKILFGYERHSTYGLLGSMKGAAKATNVFLEPTAQNLQVRAMVQQAVHLVRGVSDGDVPVRAAEAVSSVRNLNRFSSGVATRLLTLVRPDCCVSVNEGSCKGLAKLSGLASSTLGEPKNYRRLLEWVHSQPWYNCPEPNDPFERVLWSMRAALLDAFVYKYDPTLRAV
jgi:HKD family nuclease